MPPPLLRTARTDEAEAISALALRSKRLWGYDEAFMTTMTPVMRITATDIESDHVEVLEAAGRLLGFMRLMWKTDCGWLEDLFIEPDEVGRGYGRQLFERAAELSRELDYAVMRWESDPHAERFYLRLGAERIGMSPNSAIPGRSVPLMELRLQPPVSAADR